MHETSKSVFHKIRDPRYATRYLVGKGIDIGAGKDSIGQYFEFFPLMTSCTSWDMPDGDAQYMQTVENETYDFVHSSHCLEHMKDPKVALTNWLRILKPGGHLVCIVPDEDLYEQGVFPSTWNDDHKFTFTIYKKKSWCEKSINLLDLLKGLEEKVDILKVELMDATFRYKLDKFTKGNRFDQTTTPVGECSIEFILRKR